MKFKEQYRIVAILILFTINTCPYYSFAQIYDSLWLRYELIQKPLVEDYQSKLKQVQFLSVSGKYESAIGSELIKGLNGLLGKIVDIQQEPHLPLIEKGLVVGTDKHIYIRELLGDLTYLGSEGFIIRTIKQENSTKIILAAHRERGLLYGTFYFLRLLQQEKDLNALEVTEIPQIKLRMVGQWDDPAGHVERGYAGNSIFHWDKMSALNAKDTVYMRLLTSMGINTVVINNVNTKTNRCIGWELLKTERINDLAAWSALLESYGVNMYISVNFAAPILIGGLATADPLDPQVIAWWEAKAAECATKLPGFGGFLVKADSEREPGPLTYGRNHAQGANMLARALQPFGGHVVWRAFIYFEEALEHPTDERSYDLARHPYQFFAPLDGQFEDNVIVQSKFGSVDFQVREPIAPLFGGLPNTNTNLELQITQEYTGQATHLCYLVPQWKDILDQDTYAAGKGTTVRKVVDGSTFNYSYSGISGAMNFGDDPSWTGLYLAQVNTYGYGRIAWNPDLSAEEILEEWIRITYGNDPEVIATMKDIMLDSWQTYENYTSPLGVGFLCDYTHLDPKIAPNWEKRHRFEADGAGLDRTMATGSGYTGDYHEPRQSMLEDIETCPEELLLFFHHVPYTHQMKSGKTMIQHIYDTHFDGVEEVKGYLKKWQRLEGKIDPIRYEHTLDKFEGQLTHAKVWRDHVNAYFYHRSGIDDEKKRLTKKVKTAFK